MQLQMGCVEVKATRILKTRPAPSKKLQAQPAKLREALEPALRDLALQRQVHMWLALVEIYLPDPENFEVEFCVIFIELYTDAEVTGVDHALPPIPQAVQDGIRLRAAVKAMQQLNPNSAWRLRSKSVDKAPKSMLRHDAGFGTALRLAEEELERIVRLQGLD